MKSQLVRRSVEGPNVSESFSSAVLEAVDYGLSVLGETGRQTVYSFIKMKYQVKREEIPKRLDVFCRASGGLFGAGATVVNKMIAKRLYTELNLSFVQHEDWALPEYVDNAKKCMIES